MWKPGFAVAETQRARITGFTRRFCMWSIHHRGTVEDPGLVLALDPEEGGACEGLGLRVKATDAGEVIAVDPLDGVHWSAKAHAALGVAMAEEVKGLGIL